MDRRYFLLMASLIAAATLLSACGAFPRDPQDTSTTAQNGVMRVGVIHDPPFVVSDGGHGIAADAGPSGPETDLVRAYARSINARPVWLHGGPERLLEDLEHYQLEMVVGGLGKDSPWKERVAMTLPVPVRNATGHLEERVLALPPGENRWQVQIERFQRSPEGRAILEAPVPRQSVPATRSEGRR